MKSFYERNKVKHHFDSDLLPDESVDYLLDYGWGKSLQDCVAGVEKKVRNVWAPEQAKKFGKALTAVEIDAEVERLIVAKQTARAKAITEGTMGERAFGARDPLESECRKIVEKKLREKFRQENTKWFDTSTKAGRAAAKELLNTTLEANRVAIEKEAQKNLDGTAKLAIKIEMPKGLKTK